MSKIFRALIPVADLKTLNISCDMNQLYGFLSDFYLIMKFKIFLAPILDYKRKPPFSISTYTCKGKFLPLPRKKIYQYLTIHISVRGIHFFIGNSVA